MTWLETKFWRFAQYLIRKEWGAVCDDYDAACGSCRAGDVIEWIEENIRLVNW